MKLKLGFSSCPNDTYIFDAMVHQKIDLGGLEFDVVIADISELNAMASRGELDVVKVSYHAYAYLVEQYLILESGSALGKNNGPLLVSNKPIAKSDFSTMRVAIPGERTTANLLLSILFPEIVNKEVMIFSDIEQAVIKGDIDAGLLIHENRFTYLEKGLIKLSDLGEDWDSKTGSPIPLGGIVAKRSLPNHVLHTLNRVMHNSVNYAMEYPGSGLEYIKSYAQEMDESVMNAHIDLYVNQYSLTLGELGRAAIEFLFQRGNELGLLPKINNHIFVR